MTLSILQLGPRVVDLRAGVVRDATSEVRLTPVEQRLLAYFASTDERAVSQEELLTRVWGYHQAVRSRTAVVTIQRLRQKIELDPSSPRWLRTTVDGYQLVVERGPAPTDLIGRDADLARWTAAIGAGGAVALVGPPGVGKTRLLRAWMSTESGATYVDLAGRGPADALAAIANALGIEGPGAALAPLRTAMASRRLALVLDGAEAVADPLPTWIAAWADLPELTLALGSRVEIFGARTVPLEPLPPADSVRLLARRAHESGARSLAEADLQALAARLDGLPLAIELAAPRLAVVSPQELIVSLGDVLAGRSRLRDALDGAWAARSPAERQAWVVVAHLPAGALPEVVSAVLGPGWMDTIDGLRRASLLRVTPAPYADGRTLYRLLDTVAAYALEAGGAATTAIDEALMAALARWADAVALRVDGIDGGLARAALDHHWDNVAALVGRSGRAAAGAAVGLVRAFLPPAHRRLAQARLDPVLAIVEPAATDPSTLAWIALARSYAGDVPSRLALRERAVLLAKQGGDHDLLGRAMSRLGRAIADAGHIEAGLRVCEEAAVFGGPVARGEAALDVAALLSHLNRLDEACTLLERAGDTFAAAEAPAHEGQALGQLAISASQLGRIDAAIAYGGRAAELLDSSGDARNAGVVRGNLVNAMVASGRAAEAAALAEQLVETDVRLGRREDEAFHRTGLGTALFVEDRARAARELWLARDLFRRLGNLRGEAHCAMMIGILAHTEARLTEALHAFDAALQVVAGRDLAAISAEIQVRRAAAAADAGDLAAARRGLASAEQLPPAFADARRLAQRFLSVAEERAAGADRSSELAALRALLWSR